MNYKIPAPNYTQCPNIFLDEVFKTLKEGELRVVLVLMRQTFGWHKREDRLSLSYLVKKTGMEMKSVCRSINSLIKKKLVTKKKFGEKGKERCWYSLVVEEIEEDPINENDDISEEEMELISNNSYLCPKDSTPLSLGQTPSVLKTDTKETLTKEIIQKKSSSSSRDPLGPDIPPPQFDDDDSVHKKGKEEKEKPSASEILANSDSLTYRRTNGEVMRISQKEIYLHMLKKPYSTETIKEAIRRTVTKNSAVNNILKYLESVCDGIVKEENNLKKVNNKHKEESEIIEEPKPVVPFAPSGKSMLDLLNEMGFTGENYERYRNYA